MNARLAEISEGFGTASDGLGAAMSGAVMSGGKRFRGTLLLMAAEAGGGVCRASVDSAAALEIVHSASLVFDDLPCMDDAEMRRGEPATHVKHGEARAVLAGIALITEAMRVLADARDASPETRSRLVSILSAALGPQGLCAGQDLDLAGGKTPERIRREQDLKTGVLFIAGLEMLGAIKGLDDKAVQAMIAFGRQLGRVFQSYDDLLDLIGDPHAIGKDIGRDTRPDNPARGMLAVESLSDVSESYKLNRAELDDMLAVPPLASPDIQALLAGVLPKSLRGSA
ncbi:polyprenyl synthetase family protein [Paracoccus albicereus]|uniref:polyprenyl synthetase family protein n=1 Tax=Paracoccus albicereus TaxID=2922394 RepID=UPI002100C120|nr:polyprenyl synthetase family protein [Paracoccus albicereus]